jgi:hypothetical protein
MNADEKALSPRISRMEHTNIREPRKVTIPELALIAGTRVALGAGIGLLAADRLNDDQRRAVGWTLLAVGAWTTIPLAAEVVFAHGEEALAEAPQNERWAEQPAPTSM